MLNNVFLKTLRDQRGAILGWGLSLAMLAYVSLLFFPSIQGMDQFDDLLKQMPQLAGFLGDVASFTTIEGYVGARLLSFLPIALAFYAILSATANISGEIENGTIYYLLAHPVPRWRVALEKFAAIAVSVFLILIIFAIGMWLGALTIGESVAPISWFLAALTIMPLVLLYGAVAYVLACALRNRGIAIGIAAGVAIGGYVLSGLAPLNADLSRYREWSLYYLFSANKPLIGVIYWEYLGILTALAIGLAALGVYFFTRRDLI